MLTWIIYLAIKSAAGHPFNESTEFPRHINGTKDEIGCSDPSSARVIGVSLGLLLVVIIIIGIILAKRRSRMQDTARSATRSMMYRETVSSGFVETLRESMTSSVRTRDQTFDIINGTSVKENILMSLSISSQLPSYEEVIRDSNKADDALPPPYSIVDSKW